MRAKESLGQVVVGCIASLAVVAALAWAAGFFEVRAHSALADTDITQRCVASSIRESGTYQESADQTSWSVTCCGTASTADGGVMSWPKHLGDCETATGATLATARSNCRTTWATKRCQ